MQEAVEGAAYLREQAEKCVRLADSVLDREAAAALRKLAMEYEDRARILEESPPVNGAEHPTMGPPPQT